MRDVYLEIAFKSSATVGVRERRFEIGRRKVSGQRRDFTIQITNTEVVIDPESTRQAQIEFAKNGCVLLPAFPGRPLTRVLLKTLPSTEFASLAKSRGCSGDARLMVAGALFDFEFVVNRPAFCKAVGRIADSSTIGGFFSSVLVVANS